MPVRRAWRRKKSGRKSTPEGAFQQFTIRYNPGKSRWREKDVQDIDLNSVMKKCAVTLLVISTFFI
jgi:hypothetical protein